jgi:hypothetical protein
LIYNSLGGLFNLTEEKLTQCFFSSVYSASVDQLSSTVFFAGLGSVGAATGGALCAVQTAPNI